MASVELVSCRSVLLIFILFRRSSNFRRAYVLMFAQIYQPAGQAARAKRSRPSGAPVELETGKRKDATAR